MKVEIAPDAFDGLKNDPIRDFLRNIVEGIRQLLYWFPIIWKNRDWDHTYLLTIMEHKLRAMEEDMLAATEFEKNEREARNIRIAAELCGRMANNFVEENAWQRHVNVFGEPEITFVRLDESGNYGMDVVYPHDHKMATATRKWWCLKHISKQEDFYLEYLGSHLRKHVRKWWT